MDYKFKIGIIGAGNMAKAIVNGLLNNKVLSSNEIIMSATSNRQFNSVNVITDNNYLMMNSKYVIIAVKPQIFDKIKKDIKVYDNEMIISIMAGKSSNKIKEDLKCKCPVVRVMPNTPCKIAQGMIVVAKDNLNKEGIDLLNMLFTPLGKVEFVQEDLFDAVTSVSGSGPAYVYYFIKSMVEAGVEEGLNYSISLELTLQTILGSVFMVKNDDTICLNELIENVCSKGGTTIEAINEFNNNNFDNIIKKAMLKCKLRSEELSK